MEVHPSIAADGTNEEKICYRAWSALSHFGQLEEENEEEEKKTRGVIGRKEESEKKKKTTEGGKEEETKKSSECINTTVTATKPTTTPPIHHHHPPIDVFSSATMNVAMPDASCEYYLTFIPSEREAIFHIKFPSWAIYSAVTVYNNYGEPTFSVNNVELDVLMKRQAIIAEEGSKKKKKMGMMGERGGSGGEVVVDSSESDSDLGGVRLDTTEAK
jgi:hypothetical protein